MARAPETVVELSFDPGPYESVRSAGLYGYEVLAEAVFQLSSLREKDPETASSQLPPAEGPGEEEYRQRLGQIAASLPQPYDDMPLRSLVRLGMSARAGELAVFFDDPIGVDWTADNFYLREWFGQLQPDFERFFPEQLGGGLPGVLHFHQRRGDALLAQLEATAEEFDGGGIPGAEAPLRPACVLYALLRDCVAALAPHFADAAIDGDRWVREARARFFGPDQASAGKPEQWLRTLRRAKGLPESSGSILLSFLLYGDFPLAEMLASQVDVERLESSVLGPEQVSPASEPASVALPVKRSAISDLPSGVDDVGVRPLVLGLYGLLSDPGTSLPLTIGITAPWGGGKSSVMKQLRLELEGRGEGGTSYGDDPDQARTWIPIRFDAWKFERSERLWAALAKAIYDQPQAQWSWWQRTRFKVRLQILRSGDPQYWLRALVLPLALIVVAGLVAMVASPAGIVIAVGALLAASDSIGKVSGLLGHPFKRALDRYTRAPQYDDHLGFTSEAEDDIGDLVDLLTADGAALVVFVDDLDRCSPAHVVEVVEAISQIFNTAEERRCAFVLGMDRDVVAASIEVAYKATVGRLGVLDASRREGFGYSFLAKLVQLSVAVPPPGDDGVNRLLEAVTRTSDGFGSPRVVLEDLPLEVGPFRAELEGAEPARAADVDAVVREVEERGISEAEREQLEEAAREHRVRLLSSRSTEVGEAERALVRFLRHNPREIKRFDNAFRLQVFVANRTPGCRLSFDLNDLVALGKWVVLRMRWPELAAPIDERPDLVIQLEKICNAEDDAPPATEQIEEWLGKPGLRALLTEQDPELRMSRLHEETFLRVS